MAQLPRRTYGGEDLIGGVAAGVIAKTLTAPLERAKLILQCQSESKWIRKGKMSPFASVADIFRRIPKEQGGVRALLRGNMAGCLRVIPTTVLHFVFGPTVKSIFIEPLHEFGLDKNISARVVADVASGGLAAAVALAIVYPLDMARTRLALEMGKSQSLLGPRLHPDVTRQYPRRISPFGRTFGIIRDIARESRWIGRGGVYHGFSLAVTSAMIFRGLSFALYDTFAKDYDTTPEETGDTRIGLWGKLAIGFGASTIAHLVVRSSVTRPRTITIVAITLKVVHFYLAGIPMGYDYALPDDE